MNVGDKLWLTTDIYDDGSDNHHPPGYVARRGETVVVRKISRGWEGGWRIHASHEHITDRTFLLYPGEFLNVVKDERVEGGQAIQQET